MEATIEAPVPPVGYEDYVQAKRLFDRKRMLREQVLKYKGQCITYYGDAIDETWDMEDLRNLLICLTGERVELQRKGWLY